MITECCTFKRCEVTCSYCGAVYDTIEYTEDIPFFCDVCFTPSLRITDEEPAEYTS